VEPAEFEAWGRAVVERAAALILSEISAAQRPETGKTARAVSAGRGYISRYVHFRHPGYPAQRAVWLSLCRPAIRTTSGRRTIVSAPG
jgi:hypothetical protein